MKLYDPKTDTNILVLNSNSSHLDWSNAKTPQLPQMLETCSHERLVELILAYARIEDSLADYLYMSLSDEVRPDYVFFLFSQLVNTYLEGNVSATDVLKYSKLLAMKLEDFEPISYRIRLYGKAISIIESTIKQIQEGGREGMWALLQAIDSFVPRMEASVKSAVDRCEPKECAAIWSTLKSCWENEIPVDGKAHFLSSLHTLCVIPEFRKELDHALLVRQQTATIYESHTINKQRLSLVETYGTDAEIGAFFDAHIDNPDFRHQAVERAIAEKAYEKAEQLARDGIMTGCAPFANVPFYLQLHEIYTITNNSQGLAEICRHLLVAGESEYYAQWKLLLPEKGQKDEIRRLMKEVPEHTYRYIVSYEKMKKL